MKKLIALIMIVQVLYGCNIIKHNTGAATYKTIQYNSVYSPCDIQIKLEKVNNKLQYKITGKANSGSGEAEIVVDGNGNYIVFKGLKYIEYDENIKGYPDVSGSVKGDTIIIQNYGNSMNNYTKLNGCEEKYIYLVKQ